jgi:hypothetical protein
MVRAYHAITVGAITVKPCNIETLFIFQRFFDLPIDIQPQIPSPVIANGHQFIGPLFGLQWSVFTIFTNKKVYRVINL